ncbi:uncharacterized protein LOC100121739 isoform X3 [Nasonia vitripennis]|uniref:Pre-mRNA cleavage complex 2 protein Pcf11 n=1 Tax=Nasonia vitripennis TaxID=7425 RepID=A0A7M7M2T8_NASVI|nr:uncharacterized protein LOC100121739 isoform X3 [Nasonia vitripennis]
MKNRIKNKSLDYIEEGENCANMAGGNSIKEHKSDEIVKEYNSSLMDLTINSKPLINMLTLLAEDYIDHANAIVEAIEAHLQKVSSEIKLPVLYLIDSIVKNVNRAYLGLFTKNIVNTFCSVFEKVDENTRASMWKLRQTWSEVFPPKKLFALDVKVHNIDPAWPIAPLPANNVSAAKSIHVNPKFLTTQQHQERAAKTVSIPPCSTKISAVPSVKSVSTSEAEMREKLLQKQKELIELQKKKVELELLQAKASLEQQRQQLDKQSVQLPTLPDGALEKSVAAISAPSQVLKPIEKQLPAAAASLLKIDSNKSSVKIAPASSVAVASAKSVASRDPRLKMVASSATNSSLSPEELAKQQQLMHQLQLHIQSKLSGEQKQSSLLNNPVIKTSSDSELHNNKSLDNKRAKDSSQKKEPTTTNITTSHRSNSIKDQSKSSSSKSSSSRGSSSSSSSKTSSSSSSSRKPGSKSRSKSSSSSSASPNKVPKLEENSSLSPDKRSSSSSSTSSKKSKSRKTHSPSPVSSSTTTTSNGSSSQTSYRIPRRAIAQEVTSSQVQTLAINCNNKSATSSGLDEEEKSGGSLIVSLAHLPATAAPTSFKEIRANTRMRNYVRRNKEGSRSPEVINHAKKDVVMPDASKDEDLRSPIVNVNVVAAGPAAALDTKEDLDLRVLAVPNKRQSSEILESANPKKTKAEKFDALFGNEDVDLRTLTNPKAGRPPTPPPPVISHEKSKDSWAKLKTPMKSDRDPPKPLSDNRNRDRLGRPRFFNKIGSSPEDQKDGRRIRGLPMGRGDLDKHIERNADRNIEIIMKQAAEQLNQGQITKSQYNKLIQDVLHMSEDEKLKAAQRKEQEIGMLVWEKDGPGGAQNFGNDENIRKDHSGIHPRISGPGGARWQNPWHQPWSHGPPFPGGPHGFPSGPDGFRPMGPWQNHPRMFGGPMRPDFHPAFHPGGYNPRMGPPPMGPNGPMMMSNGPMNQIGPMNSMGASMMMGNGPVRPDHAAKRNSPNLTGAAATNSGSVNSSNVTTASATLETDKGALSAMKNSGELPPADPQVLEEIAKDTMKSINIDGVSREIRYYGNLGVVFLSWDNPRDIGFQDGTRRIIIDGKDSIICSFNEDYKEFTYEGEIHRIKLGTPTRELYVDDKWYECYFGGRPIMVDLGNKQVSMKLEGPPPQVKIGNTKRTDLVVGKINLIINARNMVPVFLDSKPQMFEIEDRKFTLEFIDALQTVLLNGRPFKVEFGGLPKPILVGEKKHFIRFSVLPRGFTAGYVKITGMKGEPAKESAAELAKQRAANKTMEETTTSIPAKAPSVTNLAQSMDMDTTSQDGMDTTSGSKSSGLQLDVLSSVVPSAMAPSSGLSYQAEPVENLPVVAPLLATSVDLNTLFQRLVETGIVPNLTETKKPEEEEKKEPEIISATFDKPETLRAKNAGVIAALYSGIQCSSCGARFATEMAARYSHHLDWHFRQNRKEKDSTRKAHSRSWYYDQSDWIQFEEIEDLEDRAQSWFETEKQTAETDGAATEDNAADAQQPSVPTASDDDGFCQVCHEAFEQFYNEEKEEWHLRPAVSFEEKNYHPLCLEDHKEKLLVRALEKSALELEESITEMEEEVEGDNEENDDEKKEDLKDMEIYIKEEKEDEDQIEDQDEDMKDENNEDEKPIIKTEKDDDEEKSSEPDNEEEKQQDMDVDDSEPIEIIEPLPRKIELEEIDDSSDEENEDGTKKERPKITSAEKSEEKIPDDVPLIFENVKVKEEPIDDDMPEAEESTIAEAAAVDTTQVAVKSSIDGNVELDSATPTIPTAPSKIKLNITKTLVAPKETDESKKEEKKPAESPAEAAPAKPLIPAAIKPSLQGKKLSILPTVEKGHELSGLCSIM